METLLEGGSFFESPRWHEGRWWVSDFYRHLVLTVTTDGRAEEVMTVEGQPSGLGWMPDGSLLVVSMRDHRILRRMPDGTVSEHADVTEYCGGHLNDMVVSGEGRAYAGNFGFDLMGLGEPSPAALVHVAPDGTAAVAAEDMLFPNGSVITPDGLDVFACMLGGDDGRTLLMCAAPDFAEANRAAAREAVLLMTTVDVPRAGLP
jgi:sugar lactone lactonase YvrE